ncbi:Vitamin B12 import ATP-binding protein BtuD [Eubacterium plexicaudatum ASF492]|nr:Vitamin B12 import ATP-binding protein BtuD [Eubacterium plexicaudatum ASF492]
MEETQEKQKQAVVSVKGIRKVYKLYNKPSDRFREALFAKRPELHADHYALDDINFTVKQGECIGIIGTNGSGKSTLLKIITGVLHPSQGEVRMQGRVSALLELGAGFHMEYTGVQNVYLNGAMMGFSKKEIEKRLPLIEDFAQIGDFMRQPVKTYSSGMFARLAFAAAIHVDPDILIVDEALSVGDIFFQAKCYRKFQEFISRGKTILFVSHDMSSVLKYCDRCLLLHKGRQVALGKSSEVIDIYKKYWWICMIHTHRRKRKRKPLRTDWGRRLSCGKKDWCRTQTLYLMGTGVRKLWTSPC